MTLSPGRDLSHYRLVDQIGEGGMGVVWRATDTTLGRDVAIKVLPAVFAGDPERMARFEREARLLASLNHPHIASIYGVGSAEGVRFLAMELVEGDDLATRISRGPIPVAEAVEIARQIAEALEAAHERGVIHRDLKPANVKLTADGQVKVLDFGLAKALEGDPTVSGGDATRSPTITSPMTAANVILGTAAYMSPEQARGKNVDRRADIWAFGCVLYECLTGRRAFPGDTASDTIAKILEREPDVAVLPGATPPRVRELLQRCLDKDPKHRLRDIGDARIALEEVLAARSSSGRLLMSDAVGSGAAKRAGSQRMLVVVGIVGVALGAALWHWLGPRPAAGESEPSCLTVTMPPDILVQGGALALDGRTMVVVGKPKGGADAQASPSRVYARRLDGYDFKEIAGTQGATGFSLVSDDGSLLFITPASPGSPQFRLARVPLDGSAPATTVVDWKNTWSTPLVRMGNGDLLIREGNEHFVRVPSAGGNPASPVKMDAGRPGVSFYELIQALPGDRAVLVNVVAYDSRGWHYSVGVMDARSGKVRIIEEDGGNAKYSTIGYLLFTRGDAILAAPFDLGRQQPRGAPVAVWSGLSTAFTFVPAAFMLARDGTLCYRPGQLGGDRSFAILDASGRLVPWSAERRAVDTTPEISPDGRRFACTIANARGIDEVWTSGLDSPGFQRLGTDPDADAGNCVWSPDGGRIAYFRIGKDGRDGIYLQNADGGEAKQILKHDNYTPVSWLPDGSSLIVVKGGGERASLALLTLGGAPDDTTRVRPILPSAFNTFGARLSPDGHRLVYISDEAGALNAYLVDFRSDGSTGRPVQIKTDAAIEARWAPDGSALYVRDQRNRLMKVVVAPGSGLALPPVEVCDLDKLGIAMWNILPDGRLFVGLKNDNEGDITRYNLALNWTEELKRRMRSAR